LNNEYDFFFFDCTPDFKFQLNVVKKTFLGLNISQNFCVENIKGGFITHAHIGHYLGLTFFGRECMNSSNVIIYCMNRMSEFLKNNAPFSQLVTINNIKLETIQDKQKIYLNDEIYVEPFSVKHRGEFSETCGYIIKGPNRSIVFVPDIDSFDSSINLNELIINNDVLFLDGTFFSAREIPNRNIKEIPHPLIEDSINILDQIVDDITNNVETTLSKEQFKNKIKFIHLNHTNPCLDEYSDEYKLLISKGYEVAKQFEVIFI